MSAFYFIIFSVSFLWLNLPTIGLFKKIRTWFTNVSDTVSQNNDLFAHGFNNYRAFSRKVKYRSRK